VPETCPKVMTTRFCGSTTYVFILVNPKIQPHDCNITLLGIESLFVHNTAFFPARTPLTFLFCPSEQKSRRVWYIISCYGWRGCRRGTPCVNVCHSGSIWLEGLPEGLSEGLPEGLPEGHTVCECLPLGHLFAPSVSMT